MTTDPKCECGHLASEHAEVMGGCLRSENTLLGICPCVLRESKVRLSAALARLERAEAALQPFKKTYDEIVAAWDKDTFPDNTVFTARYGDLRIAAQALSEGESGQSDNPKIDIADVCGAMGVEYNPGLSTSYYLRMIYKLTCTNSRALNKEVAALIKTQQAVIAKHARHLYYCPDSNSSSACVCGLSAALEQLRQLEQKGQ